MKRAFTILCFLLVTLPLIAGRDDAVLFARIHPERSTLYAGDSMLVTIMLYASAPIVQAECTSDFSIKGSHKMRFRSLPLNRAATASQVREGAFVYYTLVWAQYVVSPTSVGDYTIPSQKFKATLQRIDQMPSWFDRMMGARPKVTELEASGKSQPLTIKVTERPLRSTQEIMRSGKTIL